MPRLHDPLQIGTCQLEHRMVMAPLTRLRADDEHTPVEMMVEYYGQRASVPGTLIITESAFISERSRGRDPNAPGIYRDEQRASWSRVCEEVHRRGSFIYCQLWHLGRAARPHALAKAGLEMLSSSDVPITPDHGTPRPMTEDEIWQCIGDFTEAAKKAIAAGFDGVELHGANGYLIDQFTQDISNKRTDKWGGSIENRSRFALEVTKSVCAAIGPERVGLRLSPYSDFQGMRMENPVPQFSHLISQARGFGLAFLHVVEPRVAGNVDREEDAVLESLDFVRETWNKAGPIILAGGFTPQSAEEALENKWKDDDVAIAFGRHFISNPDLPFRVAHKIPLTPYDRTTFYKVKSLDGYTDYPFSEGWLQQTAASPC